jgi:nitrile hydratase
VKGGHDLGGRHGLGPVNPEPESEEPIFHADWERRVFGLTLATGLLGQWNIDESRYARESQHPVDYLNNSYYENWLTGIEKLLVQKELISEVELTNLKADLNYKPALVAPDKNQALAIMNRGGPTFMDAGGEPLFAIGERVRAKKMQTQGHSRLPAYAQGSVGTIEANYGCHVYPDKNSAGTRVGEYLYRVRFSSEQLWGASVDNSEVLVDLWQPYLESVS